MSKLFLDGLVASSCLVVSFLLGLGQSDGFWYMDKFGLVVGDGLEDCEGQNGLGCFALLLLS